MTSVTLRWMRIGGKWNRQNQGGRTFQVLAVGEACKAILWPVPLTALGFQQWGTRYSSVRRGHWGIFIFQWSKLSGHGQTVHRLCLSEKEQTMALNKKVRWLVGALSPVNHKGLYQGWTQTSLSPSYSFHKSSYHKSRFLSLFIFRGHSARKPESSRVTYFILQACTGTMC